MLFSYALCFITSCLEFRYPDNDSGFNLFKFSKYSPDENKLSRVTENRIAQINFILFLFQQMWADSLMKLAYSLNQLNASSTMYLQKAHTKLCLQIDKDKRIPVKKLVFRMFFYIKYKC